MESPPQPCSIQVEVPRFKRAFFCIPLREGLIAWGVLQAIAIVVIAMVGIVSLATRYRVDGMQVFLLCLWTAWSALDAAAAVLLVLATRKDNARHLNACYTFFTAKVCLYAALLLLSLLLTACCYSEYWYSRNLDPVRNYLLMDNVALGVIDLLLQGYLALLVRSQVLALGGRPRLSAFRVRCQLVYDQDPGADYAPVDDDLPIAYKLPGVDKPSEADKLPEKTDKNNLHSVE